LLQNVGQKLREKRLGVGLVYLAWHPFVWEFGWFVDSWGRRLGWYGIARLGWG